MKKTKLTRNFTLKIMSVFIGFLIWFIVVNVDNPVSSKSITIAGENVELQNTAYVDSANMMCMQDDDPDPIRVTITGEKTSFQDYSDQYNLDGRSAAGRKP